MVEEVQLKKTLCYGALNEDVLIVDLTVKEGFVYYSIIERTVNQPLTEVRGLATSLG